VRVVLPRYDGMKGRDAARCRDGDVTRSLDLAADVSGLRGDGRSTFRCEQFVRT
jgi:hypothetical protein